MVQILSVAAGLIPVVGPLVGFTIYIGGNTIIDAAWISQFENSTPPIFALLYSQKGNITKHTAQGQESQALAQVATATRLSCPGASFPPSLEVFFVL